MVESRDVVVSTRRRQIAFYRLGVRRVGQAAHSFGAVWQGCMGWMWVDTAELEGGGVGG